MQFIERFLGLSPDAGNGLLEFSLIAIASSAIVLQALLRRAIKRRESPTSPHGS
jgi:membrane protein implicated in regulation of membrane protease activity